MHNQSDVELMRLIRQRRRKALEELYDRYVKLVYILYQTVRILRQHLLIAAKEE